MGHYRLMSSVKVALSILRGSVERWVDGLRGNISRVRARLSCATAPSIV